MAEQKSRVAELACLIQEHTLAVEEFRRKAGLPMLSFDPITAIEPEMPQHIARSKQMVIEATDELQALMVGTDSIFHQAIQYNNLVSLHGIYRYNIATSFGINEEATYPEIAQRCGMMVDDTRRLIRHAITNHIFRETCTGTIAHTALSKTIAENPLLHQWLGHACEEMWPAAPYLIPAMRTWPGSEEPTETGFNIANGTSDSYFKEVYKSASRAERVAATMSYFHSGPGFETSHIFQGFDWKSINDGTVVDVGGSHGEVGRALVEAFPSLRCVVQDLPDVLDQARAPPAGIAERLTFQAYDFFTVQPQRHASVYFYRMVFHNWSDEYCRKILWNLIPALKDGSRLIICDAFVPEPGTISLYKEREICCLDLAMKSILNAKERSQKQWKELIESTDSRFRETNIAQRSSSQLAMIEYHWSDSGNEHP